MRNPRLLAPLRARRPPPPAPRRRRPASCAAILTPDYTLGCKRLLFSNEWYPALTRPNVDVIPHAVERVTPTGLVDAAGVERPADTIVLGTGFTITELPIAERVHGRDGRNLAETWGGSPTGYLGSTVHGFPNLFLVLGPNIGNGHSSAFVLSETQIDYMVDALRRWTAAAWPRSRSAPTPRSASTPRSRPDSAGTVWNAGGCQSYYLDANGKNSTMFPGSTLELRRRLARFDPIDYATALTREPVAPTPA